MVNGVEKFRDTTPARCQRYIQWHHKDGSLNPPNETEVPRVPTISEISFYDQEAFIGDELVASISYDHDNHQNLYWRVMINSEEIFRDISAARCHSYLKQQYQQGTLPVQEPFIEELYTTGNEIMSQIFTECEKYGFEILDDGIYTSNVKLGEVGCTDGRWWFKRVSSEHQPVIPCNSAMDAVLSLSMVDATRCEDLLDRPFEMLTPGEWEQLLEYKPQSENRELVAA
jgi:hypothetical protein